MADLILLPEGKIKRIHVFGARLRRSKKTGEEEPFYIVRYGGRSYHCRGWTADRIEGQQSLEGMPGCRHAVAWMVTTSRVVLRDVEDEVAETCEVT